MSDILMKCGHSANADQIMLDSSKIPCCVICNCNEIAESKPDLTGRKARCSYFGRAFKHRGQTVTCHGETDSKYNLAFFEYRPKNQYDKYYCGCWGWN